MELPADLFFRHGSAAALLEFFKYELLGFPKPTPVETPLQAGANVEVKIPLAQGAIAIVGMACRLPGAPNLDAFWDLLRSGGNGVGAYPADRPGGEAFQQAGLAELPGGFLADVGGFDSELFPIAGNELKTMDPQQRLMLEQAHAALEHAGVAADQMTDVAFFCGIYSNDYQLMMARGGQPGRVDAQYGSGTANAMAAGRLAYMFGSHAPALAVDTACSSSLVAVHLALQCLRRGEARAAVAAGVNLILAPQLSASFARAGMLSSKGRCATFDHAADGYVRSEGCGAVVLKPAADALRDGDTIWAVIRGSAVNQDGAGNGLTAPNGTAQEGVIQAALADAGVGSDEIQLIEAHGTGTVLGDAVELGSLARVFGGEGRRKPLWLGSVKTNIGHLEAAAGIAGLIKTALALHHRQVPAHLHYRNPNAEISPSAIPAEIPVKTQALPGETCFAGVSSFGFSGTNAHVILQSPPRLPTPTTRQKPRVWALSAAGKQALLERMQDLRTYLQEHTPDLTALCATLTVGRRPLPYRVAGVAQDLPDLLDQLEHGPVESEGHGERRIAFLFSGQGAQYAGMGAELYQRDAAFRATVDRCEALLSANGGASLLDVLFAEDEERAALINQTAYTQPALFVLEIALALRWRDWGVEPDWVMGHSVGEYAAAVFAGVMSLEDGLKLIAARGRLMQSLPGGGAMAAILGAGQDVQRELDLLGVNVDAAAYNGPANTVVSGPQARVDAVLHHFKTRGLRCVPLTVSHAFHSSLMEPIMDDFRRAAAEIRFHPPRIPLISNLSGQPAGAEITHADYWVRHIRQSVSFLQSMTHLEAQGCRLFLEIGPKAVLSGMARRCLASNPAYRFLPSLNPESPGRLEATMATLFTEGFDLNWRDILGRDAGARVPLPAYPYQRKFYWFEDPPPTAVAPAITARAETLLGVRLDTAVGHVVYEHAFRHKRFAYLADHRAMGRAIFPAAAFIETALQLLRLHDGVGLCDLQWHSPLLWSTDNPLRIQTVLEPDSGKLQFFAKGEDREWHRHAQFQIDHGALDLKPKRLTREPESRGLDAAMLYGSNVEPTPYFGPAFQGLRELWQSAHTFWGIVELPPAAGTTQSYLCHPALLDSCFHVALSALNLRPGGGGSFLLAGMDRFQAKPLGDTRLWVRCRLLDTLDSNHAIANLDVYTAAGDHVVRAEGMHFRRKADADDTVDLERLLYQITWREQPLAPHQSVVADVDLARHKTIDQPAYSQSEQTLKAFIEPLESLAANYAGAALKTLGVGAADVLEANVDTWPKRFGVAQQHLRLCGRLCAFLNNRWEDLSDPNTAHAHLLQAAPQIQLELDLLARCGSHLAEILRGGVDAVSLLFPQGDLQTATRLYEHGASFAPAGDRLAQTLTHVLAALPDDQSLRVLEVGAGTGGTTAKVLPVLGGRCREYVVTDITPFFSQQLLQRLQNIGKPRFQVLDLEKDPATQGFNQPFDLIIAANVVHATADLRSSLTHLGKLCAAGGMIMLLEGNAPRLWIDLIFGLTDGWWRFTDTSCRADYPLLNNKAWLNLLQNNGFTQALAIGPGQDMLFPQSVLCAKRTVEEQAGEDVLLVVDNPVTAQSLGAYFPKMIRSHEVDATRLERVNQVVFWAGRAHQPDAVLAENAALLQVVQNLLKTGSNPPDLHVITWNAAAASAHQTGVPGMMSLWGLLDALRVEHPELTIYLADLAGDDIEERATALLHHLRLPPAGTYARRDGNLLEPQLQNCPVPRVTIPALKADASYLITGGLGATGLLSAQALADWGAGCLVLVGRGQPSGDAQAAIARLQARGIRVETRALDVGDSAAVTDLTAQFGGALPPLRGVIHAAGVFADKLLAEQDRDGFARVFTAKVNGAYHLDQATRHLPLDFFVLYSSAMTFLPATGMANYLSANRFLDGLARARRAAGLPAASIGWGPWRGVGMAVAVSPKRREQWESAGLQTIEPDDALTILGLVVGGAELPAYLGAVAVDWDVFAKSQTDVPDTRYQALIPDPDPQDPHVATASADLLQAYLSRETSHRLDFLSDQLKGMIAQLLDTTRPKLKPRLGLFQQGMDSLSSMELRTALQARLALKLPATLLFKYPSIEQLADYLDQVLTRRIAEGVDLPTSVPPTAPTAEPRTADSPQPAANLVADHLDLERDLANLESLLETFDD